MGVSRSGLFGSTACAVLIASLPLAAVQPSPQPTPAPMTITGCLRSGPNPSGVPDTITYTLEPIETAPTPSPAASGVESMKAKTGTRYALTASQSVELKAHVGHKVELSGHLKDLSAAEKPDKRDQPTPPPQRGGAHNTFEVVTLKMVAPKCP